MCVRKIGLNLAFRFLRKAPIIYFRKPVRDQQDESALQVYPHFLGNGAANVLWNDKGDWEIVHVRNELSISSRQSS